VAQLFEMSAPFTYRHGFISSVFATSARNFAQLGIFRLGGVPIENNPPIATDDLYGHWPPAFPILLSFGFRMFGVSEAVGHLLMLGITIVTALLIFAIARSWLPTDKASLAAALWLAMPVVVHYSHVVVPESLAILLMLASTFAFVRGRAWLAAATTFAATCTSWEAVFFPLGLWLASIASKRPGDRRTAAFCSLGVIGAMLCICTCYGIRNPALVQDGIHTALFRMGLSHTYSQRVLVFSSERYVGLGECIERILLNFPRMLGIFGASALALMALSRPKGSGTILFALGTPWLLWCIAMRNHMAVHDIEMQLAAPVAAIALAWVGLAVIKKGNLIVRTLAVILIAIQPWVLGTETSPEDPVQIIGFAQTIRRTAPRDAVVLSPLVSAIPLYYSERHLIRCIPDESALKRVLPYVREQYPHSPLYWATPLYRAPWATVTQIR
jgi:hypothetical protein